MIQGSAFYVKGKKTQSRIFKDFCSSEPGWNNKAFRRSEWILRRLVLHPKNDTKFLTQEILTTDNENGLRWFISLSLFITNSCPRERIFPQSPLCYCNINAEFLRAPFWSQLFLSVLVAFVCIYFPCKPGKVVLLKDESPSSGKKC